MKLISMTDFVLEQGYNPLQNDTECWIKTHKYANFLKQPLTLGMFVPCDLEGNVLEELDADFYVMVTDKKIVEFQQAKERCLFEGFEHRGETEFSWIFKHGKTYPIMVFKRDIECLVTVLKREIELTQTALKQLGL